jgi:hypothetical protein
MMVDVVVHEVEVVVDVVEVVEMVVDVVDAVDVADVVVLLELLVATAAQARSPAGNPSPTPVPRWDWASVPPPVSPVIPMNWYLTNGYAIVYVM